MKKFILGLTAASLCALVPISVYAGPFEDGESALEREDYTTAYKLLSPLAHSGNADAQFQISLLYLNGFYGTKSERNSTGVMMMRRLADDGYLSAQKVMSNLESEDIAYGVSEEESQKYLLMAAKQGDAVSQYFAGLSHSQEKNYPQARYWYEKVAAQGHVVAELELKELPAAPPFKFSIYDKKPAPDKPLTFQDANNAENRRKSGTCESPN